MRAQEFITEAFNQPYSADLSDESEHGDYDSLTQLPDGSYLTVMFNNQGDGEYQVEFWRGPSQGVTGEGDAQRIFATVLNTIQRFIKEHTPWRLTFSATKDVEPGQNSESRAKLYNRLVDRYARAWGYDAYNEDHGDQVTYELTRLKPSVAEGSPNFNREWDEATRYPEFVNLGKKKWIELVSKGKPVTVTRKNVNKINNTDAADPTSFKLLDPEKQKRALAQLANGDVEMPIVARYSDGYLELIGGNTRLTAQMAKDGQAKVWLFNVPEELTQGVAEATGDEKFDTMMSRMAAEPKVADMHSNMPPTSIPELLQWANKNNKPYHRKFAEWARNHNFTNVNAALEWFGDNVDPWDEFGSKEHENVFGELVGEPLIDAAKHDPKAAELLKVYVSYEKIFDDWTDKYRQMNYPDRFGNFNEQGIAEGLNFDEIYGKYLKVTDNNGDPDKPGFSLVTPLNGDSWNWRERPEFKDLVKQKLNNPGFLGDHKYQQIIDAMSGKQFDPTKHIAKENFADGKVKGKSRPGRVKRAGASCDGSVTSLRQRAKNASGEKAKMYHWCANMKGGKK